MRIVCIDPGMSNTGMVYMDERGIYAAMTAKTKPSRDKFAHHARMRTIIAQLSNWLIDKPHECVVVEDFRTFGRMQHGPYAHETPYLCGFMDAVLDGEQVVWQFSTDVFGHGKKERALNSVRYMTGADMCTNEHTRSAAAHGVYFLRNEGLI